jgi:23S rRNA pseudouridine2605 synthase
MRINQYIARYTGLSRRAADDAISRDRVAIDGQSATLGQSVAPDNRVTLDGRPITPTVKTQTVLLNKPTGYICSREGQGGKTIYDLLPPELRHLKPVGRLDKDSSGLLLLTNDGQLAHQLTHPSHQKTKVYQVELDKLLTNGDKEAIEQGVELEDGVSSLQLEPSGQGWTVTMREGRNRQIRRTFVARGYRVTKLHRIVFGPYKLDNLDSSKFKFL